MELTPRITKILNLLLEQEKAISEQEIADKIGVSRRTVMREFEYLEPSLKEDYGVSIVRKKGIGVWIEASDENKKQLQLSLKNSQNDWSDKHVRRKYLTLELLKNKEPRKIFAYANQFNVSESTISKDLKEIEKWFHDSHLEIIKKGGYGVSVSGSEESYRYAIQRFLKENSEDEDIRSLLNNERLEQITKTLLAMDEPRLKSMTESSFTALVMHIAISIERILQGELIHEGQFKDFKPEAEYMLAVKVANQLEKEFELTIPQEEINYIMLHIKGSKLQYTTQNTDASYPLGAENVLDIVDQMIDAFDQEAAYELKLDEDFIHGLLVHLDPTFTRLRNEMNIYNPILEDIKKEYPEIFAKCKNAAKVITNQTGFEVNDEEIGYLTMHFGAAMERIKDQKHKERMVEIGVICASGFGVARLMLTKLQNQLKKQVNLHAYGKDELTPYTASKIDFFVTSIDLEQNGVDYLQVSPLIPERDMQRIRVKVDEYARMPVKTQTDDFSRQLDEINFLATKIKQVIKRYKDLRIDDDCTFNELLTFISKSATNKVPTSVILKEDLLARESLMSQIFPELKIALLHCKTRAVDEVAFYTCRTVSGDSFKDPYLKSIQAAVILLMPIDANRQQNSQLLGHISSSLIDNDEFMQTILYRSEEEIRSKLEKILKTYFNNYLSQV
ncbi:Phosphotransferase system, lactose/cellobiose-specific IIB subunit:PRD [Lachnospiraceae bacterium TWA4]|nr:Phosphotransferase system, lactose/cellobiose-specific IIB subunit:PRD [Lachnospiraceae bacterium TWA4]